MGEKAEVLTVDKIQNRVYVIRGQQVMLDCDLAEIYGYEVKALNQQVKRNISRFPEDFMFQLEKDEIPMECLKSQFVTLNEGSGLEEGIEGEILKSQIATSNDMSFENGRVENEILKSQIVTSSWGGKRKLPYAFTEQGIYMLATVLRGELAEQQSIFIMRAFREMRHYIKQNQQFVMQSEMRLVTAKVSEISVQVAGITDWKKKTEQDIDSIRKSIDTLNENFVSENDFKSFVIYKGQKFEADTAYIDIYQQATKSIYVVDDYMNAKTLQLLSQKKQGIEVILFTENGHGRNGFLTSALISDFAEQYPSIRIKSNSDCHDRLIVIDYNLPTEQVYHCGASSKDAGKKLCAINKIENNAIIHPVIDSLLLGPDKMI